MELAKGFSTVFLAGRACSGEEEGVMKKRIKKLTISKETVRNLGARELQDAEGGVQYTFTCYTWMGDCTPLDTLYTCSASQYTCYTYCGCN